MLPCLRRRLWAVVCVCGIVLAAIGTSFDMLLGFVLQSVLATSWHRAHTTRPIALKLLTLCLMLLILLVRLFWKEISYVFPWLDSFVGVQELS